MSKHGCWGSYNQFDIWCFKNTRSIIIMEDVDHVNIETNVELISNPKFHVCLWFNDYVALACTNTIRFCFALSITLRM